MGVLDQTRACACASLLAVTRWCCGGDVGCLPGALVGQGPDTPARFAAGTSELSAGFERSERFEGAAGTIDAVRWWGLELELVGGEEWVACTERDPTFLVRFRTDAAGIPGIEVASAVVTATRVPTGLLYDGFELVEYVATLPEPVVLTNGWLTIVGLGGAECWFLWMGAGDGASLCDYCVPSLQEFDLSFCLVGTTGGVFGACCDDASGTCVDGVGIADCVDASLRFEPDATCASLVPACGVELGACCFVDQTCLILTQAQCESVTGVPGEWNGPDTICVSCPCEAPCPELAGAEGEFDCADGYIDIFNGGCDAERFASSPIAFGETMCGTSGVFERDGAPAGDVDWYELPLTRRETIRVNVRGQFRPLVEVRDLSDGCPGTVLASDYALECAFATIEVEVGPGPTFVTVRPLAATDTAACGARYTLSVTGEGECVGDFDANGFVDGADLGVVLASWGTSTNDLDGDGIVNGVDLVLLLGSWGVCD